MIIDRVESAVLWIVHEMTWELPDSPVFKPIIKPIEEEIDEKEGIRAGSDHRRAFAGVRHRRSSARRRRSATITSAALNTHPYFLDTWLGIEYTKKELNVDITVLGPNDYDTAEEAAAIEQTIPKKPDGIMVPLWDSAPVPAIKKAMAAGIPVVAVYTTVPDSGALGYVGLDNWQAGLRHRHGADQARWYFRKAGHHHERGRFQYRERRRPAPWTP